MYSFYNDETLVGFAYLLIEEQGYLTIYKLENNGDKTLESKTNVSLEYLTDPIVSTDIIGSTAGSLFDSALTKEIIKKDGKKLYKVISWYDNESSYVSQFVRTLKKFADL